MPTFGLKEGLTLYNLLRNKSCVKWMQTKQEDAKKGCLLSCPFLKFSWGLQWEPHILSLATQHCYHCQSGQKRSLLPIIIRSKNPFLPDKNEISREGTYSALALKEEKRRIWSREYINTRGVCRYVHLHPQFFTFIAHQLKRNACLRDATDTKSRQQLITDCALLKHPCGLQYQKEG